MYVGANTWAGGEKVSANARAALSADGIRFDDQGVVLAHFDRSDWGSGDELFPIAAFGDGARHVVNYVPNGTPQSEQLGLARSDGSRRFRSAATSAGRTPVRVWESGSATRIGAGVLALFLSFNRGEDSYMEVRTVPSRRPERLSEPIRRFEWTSAVPQSAMFDDDAGRWPLFYRVAEHFRYGVMVAVPGSGAGHWVSLPELCGILEPQRSE